MGSPNFGFNNKVVGRTWGYDVASPTDEEVADFIEEKQSEYNFELTADQVYYWLLSDNHELCAERANCVEDIQRKVEDVIGRLWKYDGVDFPYTCIKTDGYNDGWAIYIEQTSEHIDVYEQLPDTVTLEECQSHIAEVLDAVLWAFDNACFDEYLLGITDGWCGGSYKVEVSDLYKAKEQARWEQVLGGFKSIRSQRIEQFKKSSCVIDGRKSEQHFRCNDGSVVYVWKLRDGGYVVNLNKERTPFKFADKQSAEQKVEELLNGVIQ